jgi:hypothetical protein
LKSARYHSPVLCICLQICRYADSYSSWAADGTVSLERTQWNHP